MKTKYGNTKIDNCGHYRITSRKEGNHNKLLHRLIWEDFWKTEVPKGYVIHHRNFNKLDNCILNLQLMRISDHVKLHNNSMNTTGYFHVTKEKDKCCKQGFIWKYQDYEDGKRKVIRSVSLDKLEQKVRAKGLKWEKLED